MEKGTEYVKWSTKWKMGGEYGKWKHEMEMEGWHLLATVICCSDV